MDTVRAHGHPSLTLLLGACIGLGWGLTSCTTLGEFACQSDDQCVGAGPGHRCEPDNRCSIQDSTCDSGHRYVTLLNQPGGCTDVPDSTTTTGPSVDATSATTGQLTVSLDSATTGDEDPSTTSNGAAADASTGAEGSSVDTSTGTDTDTDTDTGTSNDELCDDIDNDGDGLIDEISPANMSCGGCRLLQWGEHAYYACDAPRTWEEALTDCEAFGAELAVIRSPGENVAITEFAQGASLWLGASDLAVEGQWRWVDNSNLPNTHPQWGPGQPDDNGVGPEGEDCLHLTSGSLFADGDWNDDICDMQPYGALCKAPHAL